MHLSIALTGDHAAALDELADRYGASPASVAKAVLVAALNDNIVDAVLDGNAPVRRERSVRWMSHEDAQLEQLRAEGKSYGQIARILRRTRSSTIGRAARLGLMKG